jgi:NAD(P)-dependent dehydrogenase (short-subunit alcohol dehydrogenase family)
MPDRAAIITGASRGIGFALAEVLGEEGFALTVTARKPEGIERAAGQLQEKGFEVQHLAANMADEDSIRQVVDRHRERYGRLDVLVNNAGTGPPETPAEDVSVEDFDATVELNLKGTFFCSQAAGRAMIRQGAGRIVNLSSQAGFVALPGESVYCMTKAAISHLTKCLAVEWGEHGVTVNAVAPTFIETPGTAPALSDPAFRADVEERIAALHRVGTPADVTGAVLFLASPAASLITGHTLMVDGGWTAR